MHPRPRAMTITLTEPKIASEGSAITPGITPARFRLRNREVCLVRDRGRNAVGAPGAVRLTAAGWSPVTACRGCGLRGW